MKVPFRNRKLPKVLNSERELLLAYGPDNGRRIARRLQNIANAANLEELSKLPQTRLHQLTGDSHEQLSVDVKHPYRLVLVRNHDETPRKPDGGLDWARITKVQVIEISAWLRLGERLAQQVRTEPYDQDRFIKALHEIRKLTRAEPEVFAPQAAELCRGSGVALVFVPELPATRVHGATRWLTPQKALLQLSSRGKTDDLLWFAFYHEAAHILKHGKREVFIEAPDGTADEEARRKEEEADTFASEFLIPRNAFNELRQQERFSAHRVQRFADKLGIAPGIVVGRLQHEKLVRFDHLNAIKRRLRLKDPSE